MPSLYKARLIRNPSASARTVREFVYRKTAPAGPERPSDGELPEGASLLWDEESAAGPSASSAAGMSEDEMRAREQRAWEAGFQEAKAQAQEDTAKALATECSQLAAALSDFAKEREAYYQQIEAEVVQLVLSIARKILHRESQVDPMLLTGVVRVALEKLASETKVKLQVPAGQADAWRSAITSAPVGNLSIEVVADESLNGPCCLVATEMGSTDVSLEAQLREIERGFLDLLAQRPASAGNGN